jgi:SPP1 family predicted phage head-tail adaptor
MDANELDKRITLQQLGAAVNELNESTEAWVNLIPTGDGKLWARVRDMSGRQYIAATANQNVVMTEIRIRKRDGVVEKMRALHRDDIYDIEAVLERERGWLDLMCTRGQNNG